MTADGPGPLAPCERRAITTTTVEDAENFLRAAYGPVKLDTESDGPLEMRVLSLRLDTMVVGTIRYDADVRMLTDMSRYYHVNLPLASEVLVAQSCGTRTISSPGCATVLLPGATVELRFSARSEQLGLLIPEGTLERQLEQLLGRPLRGRLDFAPAMDLRSPVAAGWRALLDVVHRELEQDGGLMLQPAAARHVEALLVDGLLLGHHHNYRDELVRDRTAAPPPLVSRAIELLEARPAEPWSNTSLARELHVSVRALHDGFRRTTGTGPMTYLRNARLRGVHQNLRDGDATEVTVSTVAARWGFLHMGRFAAQYRARFGELPSETLRK